jgi:tetratricopeptide (TPR) repeat protein
VEQYVIGKLKGHPEVEQAQQRMLRESSVVPVALELGMLLLEHAQGRPDPKSRKEELDEAEKVFLSVGRLARENDAYRLNLAQVYYWQGKHREGRALFDEVLAARKRDPKLLVSAGEMLRRVGSQAEARALVEEAYRSATDPNIKQSAAIERGLLGTDLDDKILWLRRGNPTEPRVKALLNMDLAEQAMIKGGEAEAIAYLRDAIAIYEAMPEAATLLNNAAMALFRLSALTGDPADFDRGLAKIEKARKLEPSDSLTMGNAAQFLLTEALRDILGPTIDLRLLKEDADLDMLEFLYRDRAGRMDYRQRTRSHPGLNRAIDLLEKASLLSPRRGGLYKILNELYAERDEPEKQRALLQRLERVDLDQTGEIALAKSVYAGGRKDEMRSRATTAIARSETALKAARARKRDLTFAVAAATLAGNRISGFASGLEADPDAIVSLAEEAHSVAPSYRTRGILMGGLSFRAGRRLARSQPAYARMADKTRMSTSDTLLVCIALNGDNPLRDAARQDPDIRRVVETARAASRDDPEPFASGWTWCLLRAFDPQEGARIARTFVQDESARISSAVRRRVEPMSAATALSLSWSAEMAGRADEGRAILKEYAARGVPLPIESP